MKASLITALVVVVAIVAFAAGNSLGFGGLMIAMVMGQLLIVVGPATLAVLAVVAGIFALGAGSAGGKPNWNKFFVASGVIVALALLATVIAAFGIVSNGLH